MEPPLVSRRIIFLGMYSVFSVIITTVTSRCPNGETQLAICRVERRCNLGTCELSGDCEIVCKCPVEFTGTFCQTTMSQSQPLTTDTIPACVVDAGLENQKIVCMINQQCLMGVCYINKTVCDVRCHCHQGYEGTNCQTELTTKPTSNTLSPDHTQNTTTDKVCVVDSRLREKETVCMITQQCLVGDCYINKTVCDVRCHCHQGYEGTNCQTELTTRNTLSPDYTQNTTTDRACVVDSRLREKEIVCMITQQCLVGDCYINKTVCDVRCHCHPGYEGTNCQTELTTEPTSNTFSSDNSQNTTTDRECVVDATLLEKRRACWNDQHCLTGYCHINKTICDIQCLCRDGFEGTQCQTATNTLSLGNIQNASTSTDELTTGQTVGIALAAIVGMLLLFVLITSICLLWKHRMNCLLSCRLRWCDCRSYEDDDCASYDVFVWYKETTLVPHTISTMTSDEHMSLRRLLPKLEGEMGYRVCMPFRDFPLNTSLESNIMNVVRTSRRVILVTSQDTFKDSIWLQPQYKQALYTLVNRRKNVIIVKVGEVAESNDIWINALFESAQIVEWPDLKSPESTERFWLKMELAMPRIHCTDSINKRPVLVTQESCFSTQTETSTISMSDLDNDGFSDIIDMDACVENSYNTVFDLTDKQIHINDDSSLCRETIETKDEQLLQTVNPYEQTLGISPESTHL